MSAVEHSTDLDAESARQITDRIRIAVEGTWQMIRDAYNGRVWIALGYSSWDDYTTREFGNARLRLPREERTEQVASLRESGLSIRAIAAGLGVSPMTVQTDLAGVPIQHTSEEAEPPKITGADGKQYAASAPVVESPAFPVSVILPAEPTLHDFVEAFPDLQWFVDGGRAMEALRLGRALAAYKEPELTTRLDALHATVAAEKRGADIPRVQAGPDYVDLASQMYLALNRAEAIVQKNGGSATLASAMARADRITADSWRQQFERIAALASEFATIAKPGLRRAK